MEFDAEHCFLFILPTAFPCPQDASLAEPIAFSTPPHVSLAESNCILLPAPCLIGWILQEEVLPLIQHSPYPKPPSPRGSRSPNLSLYVGSTIYFTPKMNWNWLGKAGVQCLLLTYDSLRSFRWTSHWSCFTSSTGHRRRWMEQLEDARGKCSGKWIDSGSIQA